MSAEKTDAGARPVEVRFCGGCNPHIDRLAVAEAVIAAIATIDTGTSTSSPPTVYVCGCQRACAAGHRLRIADRPAVVVAGECVDGVPTAADRLAEAVVDALEEIAAVSAGATPGGAVAGSEQSKE